MEQAKYIIVNNPEIESLLDAIESAPKEEQSLMALMADTFIKGMKTQAQLLRQSPRPGG